MRRHCRRRINAELSATVPRTAHSQSHLPRQQSEVKRFSTRALDKSHLIVACNGRKVRFILMSFAHIYTKLNKVWLSLAFKRLMSMNKAWKLWKSAKWAKLKEKENFWIQVSKGWPNAHAFMGCRRVQNEITATGWREAAPQAEALIEGKLPCWKPFTELCIRAGMLCRSM